MSEASSAWALPNLRTRLLAGVQENRLELPTLPESNAAFAAIVETETVDSRRLLAALAGDPVIASQLLRVANTAPFGDGQRVGSLGIAVKRLGLSYASELAVGLSNRLVFQPTSEMIERRFRIAVRDATYVGAACMVLARNFTELPAERARVAGLCHNVGALPILAQAEYENFADTFALQEIVETLQVLLSSALLKHWNFPAEICEIPGSIANHQRTGSAIGLLDLVVAARGLNRFFNHDAVASAGSLGHQDLLADIGTPRGNGHGSPLTPQVLPQALSLLIYEITGFDPLSNFSQIEVLNEEIIAEEKRRAEQGAAVRATADPYRLEELAGQIALVESA